MLLQSPEDLEDYVNDRKDPHLMQVPFPLPPYPLLFYSVTPSPLHSLHPLPPCHLILSLNPLPSPLTLLPHGFIVVGTIRRIAAGARCSA